MSPVVDPIEAAMVSAGFSFTIPDIKPRLLLSVEGMEKSGKTHFSLTAPGPIAYLSIDMGDEGIVQKFPGKRIAPKNYDFKVPSKVDKSDQAKVAEAVRVEWERFVGEYRAALAAKARTIIIDTASEMWEFLRIARLGKLTQVMPMQYGPVNAEMRELIRMAYDGDSNLILLHKTKEQWQDNAKTGRMERKGFSEIGYLVQAMIRCRYVWPVTRTESNGTVTIVSPGRRFVDVMESRMAPEMSGSSFENMDFAGIATMLAPQINPVAWMG